MRNRNYYSRFLVISLIALTALTALAGLSYQWLFRDIPNPKDLSSFLPHQSIQIVDRDGRLLYELLPSDSGRHVRVLINEIPNDLIFATLATEDVNFYYNQGVDILGIFRAFWIDIKGGKVIAGGSTITQQLARNVLLSSDERSQKSIRRKLRETYLAWRLSQLYTKNEILALYLNYTYYGGLAYGVEAAARTFFGKSASELDLAQSALIAGLPQAPALYNPYTHPEAALERQKIVLSLMEKAGFISNNESEQASNETLVFNEEPYPIRAPHLVMMVRNEIDNLLSKDNKLAYNIAHEGLIVYTTINLNWQDMAEKAIQNQIERLKRSPDGLGHNVNNAALVAVDPYTSEILALVGSSDYFDQAHHGAINMTLAPRQPGSALKPLIYAAAMDPSQLDPWTAATMILDIRTSFITHDGKTYTPKNYDSKEHGPVLVRDALASSLNIPAVITLHHIGLERFSSFIKKMGITTLESPQELDLSLALGGGSVSLLDLTRTYAAFANGGYRIQPYFIKEIKNTNNEVLFENHPLPKSRVLDNRLAWLITDILSDKDAREIGFGKNTILQLERPAAVKTGTTTNFHDNWTIGYTPKLVVGVWVGNADNQPMREVTGLTGAAPVWHQFVRSVLKEEPPTPFVRPPGLVAVEICELSGLLPSPVCPYRRKEWFIEGTQPQNSDTLFHEIILDLNTGKIANELTPPNAQQPIIALDLPLEAENWAKANGTFLLRDIQSRSQEVIIDNLSSKVQLIISSPPQNSLYRISHKAPLESQSIKISALTSLNLRSVKLWIDDQLLAELSSPPFETWWNLQAGNHQVWAQALLSNGELVSSLPVTFTVENPSP